MDYPKWAPADLVKAHREYVLAVELGPVHQPTEEEMNDPNSCQDCGCLICRCDAPNKSLSVNFLRYEIESAKVQEPIIGRMLRDGSMRDFWTWAQAAEAAHKATAMAQKEGDIGSAIWYGLREYMESFKYLPKRTGTEKKKALGKIAKLTRELRELIAEDEDAHHYASSVLRGNMLRKVREFQRGFMQLPESEVWRWSDPLPDEDEARSINQGKYEVDESGLRTNSRMDMLADPFPQCKDPDNSDECLPWGKQPLEQRLAWWHVETPKTCLLELLDMFAEGIDRESETPPIIKQRRDDGGWRAFMVRACAGLLQWHFKTVPAERIADLAGAVLDESLTRDDVRPYLRGKISPFAA